MPKKLTGVKPLNPFGPPESIDLTKGDQPWQKKFREVGGEDQGPAREQIDEDYRLGNTTLLQRSARIAGRSAALREEVREKLRKQGFYNR